MPQRVLPATKAWPLFDVATSRAIEAHELQRHAPGLLMQRAGRAVARWALALAPHARSVWVAAGPGGNGGDGLHAAADLAGRGLTVVVTLCADVEHLPPDARSGLDRAQAAGVSVIDTVPAQAFDLGIDALLGLGASRAPSGRMATTITALNAMDAPRLAVDLPSGLAADTGALLGDVAVAATATLALLTLKPGLFTARGRDHTGSLWFDDLGAQASDASPATRLTATPDADAVIGPRQHAQHKGSFGDVIVVGGAPGMVGAARLAAHGALGAGAGRTWVSLLDSDAPMGDMTRPEWLWTAAAWLPGRADLEHTTVVCGCGGGDAVRTVLPALLSRSARLVLDADALNAIAADPALLTMLQARSARGRATILTPHPLEAARLLGTSTPAVQADRLAAAQALVTRTGSVVVLKGSGTVIAGPDQTPAINSTGNAALASGGTGDVLAGWIGGLWSQVAAHGESPHDTAWRCAAASVWRHGAAADAAASVVLHARDLVDAMRALRSAP
jgi:ADP-dependent NAD(P)H-hydrate dehydratase / NAD(P)H-hydrate epimerase